MSDELQANERKSIEAERSVIGCMMLEPRSIATAVEILRPQHFYVKNHRVAFQAIAKLAEDGPVDSIRIGNYLRDENLIEGDSAVMFVADTMTEATIPAMVEQHSNYIKDQWRQRALIYKLHEHLGASQKGSTSVDAVIDAISQDLTELSDEGVDNGPRAASDDVDEMDAMLKTYDRGIPTAFNDLTRIIGGYRGGDVLVLAGRTSMGKTALAVKLVHHMAFELKQPVLFNTLEMSRTQILLRLCALDAKMSSFHLLNGDLDDKEKADYEAAKERLRTAPIFIDDTSGLSIGAARYRARAMKRQHKIKVMVNDYLQIFTYDGKALYSREQEVARIADGFKAIAKDLDLCVLCLAQLSRETEKRKGNKPQLSDLRESGAIEQMADVVGFIHRPEYYSTDYDPEIGDVAGKAFIYIEKHRNGETGEVELYWNKGTASFEQYVS